MSRLEIGYDKSNVEDPSCIQIAVVDKSLQCLKTEYGDTADFLYSLLTDPQINVELVRKAAAVGFNVAELINKEMGKLR